MTREELYAALCDRIPAALSEEWDNDGIMVMQNGKKEVSRVVCTLDVTPAVVAHAKETGADLIISHHPLVFQPLRALTPADPVGARVIDLLAADIAVFSFHTRFDAVAGGINDGLCELLGLSDVTDCGMMRLGSLPSPLSVAAFSALVREKLGVPAVNTVDKGTPVSRVAVLGGEGKDFVAAAKEAGADVYLTGNIGYHAMLDTPLSVIEAGHYYTERHAAALFSRLLSAVAPGVKTEIYTPDSCVFY